MSGTRFENLRKLSRLKVELHMTNAKHRHSDTDTEHSRFAYDTAHGKRRAIGPGWGDLGRPTRGIRGQKRLIG